MEKIPSSEITPEHLYLSRRRVLKGALFTAAAAALAACAPGQIPTSPAAVSPSSTPQPAASPTAAPQAAQNPTAAPAADATRAPLAKTDELGAPLTSFESVTTYNNFYEFGYEKEEPALYSKDFVSSPWQVSIGGLVRKPMTVDVDDLRKKYAQEDRIYRLRCVEAWSMVIPWMGFPLARLLQEVEPTSDAKYVRFESLLDPKRFPGQNDTYFQWPYVEGLRLDEAMNELAILATGVYGKQLLPQNGAPVRLVVPWKYGFKSIKSIVKIDLVAEMPRSLWMASSPNEYGFYANVNPEVSHPRWSQATERRIEANGRIPTLKFNGYDAKVTALYTGMDLKKNY
jgi:sulfoxide reductase catalytic subunit YedY